MKVHIYMHLHEKATSFLLALQYHSTPEPHIHVQSPATLHHQVHCI